MVLAVLLSATATGCAPPNAPTDTLTMTDFAYDPQPVVIPADTPGYPLQLINDGTAPHDFSVEGLPNDIRIHLAILPGDQTPYPLPAIPPGEYTLYCGVVGHREAGMETLLVAR
ncbi:cupredoxin domain-containing protein [Euzebya tangerina]|uniref:cupredoxin domain-containing protein n=1 Tax=Euzebya tangerina TaxID=591198 RepID=UPI000E313CFF|nr:cupredoxin domain-containing protein [Euzebya tangerina]